MCNYLTRLTLAMFIGLSFLSCRHQVEDRSPFEAVLDLFQQGPWYNNTNFHAEIAPYCQVQFFEDNTYQMAYRGDCNTVVESGTYTVVEGALPIRPSIQTSHLSVADAVLFTIELSRLAPVLQDSIACGDGLGSFQISRNHVYWEITECTANALGIGRYEASEGPCFYTSSEYSLTYAR